MMIARYTASIIAHNYASNMVAIFTDYMLEDPKTASIR